jgi:hypothetical protein
MEADARTRFISRLSNRGVSLKAFDGQTLTVHYDAKADTERQEGHFVTVETLSRYVKDVLEEVPNAAVMFPGLMDIVVEFSATD